MEIKIDKDIPVPVRPGGVVTKYAPTVRALNIGDSFWIPKNSVGTGFPAALRRLSTIIGIKTVIRTVTENQIEGWRVWRVEKVATNGDSR